LTHVALIEVSLVAQPMQPLARVHAVGDPNCRPTNVLQCVAG